MAFMSFFLEHEMRSVRLVQVVQGRCVRPCLGCDDGQCISGRRLVRALSISGVIVG